MKVYNLACALDHRFEGWFASEEDYLAQSETQQIACPVCDSHEIRKLPSAPHLSRSRPQQPEQEKEQAPQQLRTMMLELVRQVVANTEDVGERFAEEARRIHYKETEERAIRGVATVQEFVALAEEGIDVVPFPIPGGTKQTVH